MVLWLTFLQPEPEAVFFPNSSYPEGQNALYAMACTVEIVRGCTFQYVAHLASDIRLVTESARAHSYYLREQVQKTC